MPKVPAVPADAGSIPLGWGAEGLGRREGLLPGWPPAAAAVARLAFREVSLGQGVREANSQVVPEEKLADWESRGDPECRHLLHPVWCWVLPAFSANPGEEQSLPRKLAVVLWRQGEKENNTSSEWHVAFLSLLVSWPGLEWRLRTA